MPLLLLVVFSIAIVLLSPYIGELTRWLRARHPYEYEAILLAVIYSGLTIVAIPVSVRLARKPLKTLLGLILSAILIYSNTFLFGTQSIELSLVESIHFFEYAFLAILAFFAFQRHFPDPSVYCIAVLYATFIGILDETLQFVLVSRWGDIRDIVFNLSASLVGVIFLIFILAVPVVENRFHPPRLRRCYLYGAFVFIAVGAFFSFAHTGHIIKDGETGAFRSYYPPSKLLSFSKEKDNPAWLKESKRILRENPRWAVQDFYRVEGIRHYWVFRHSHYLEPDLNKASGEYKIMEKYYRPVMKLVGLKLPPEQIKKLYDGRSATQYTSPHYDAVLVGKRWGVALLAVVGILILAGMRFYFSARKI